MSKMLFWRERHVNVCHELQVALCHAASLAGLQAPAA